MDNIIEKIPQFSDLKRVDYRFLATKENVELMAECVKNLVKNNVAIDIYRDGEEIVFEIFEL